MRKREYLKIVREVGCVKLNLCAPAPTCLSLHPEGGVLPFFFLFLFLKIHSKMQTRYPRVLLSLKYYCMDEM